MQTILFYTEREHCNVLDNMIKYALGLAVGKTQYRSIKILNSAVPSESVIQLNHVHNTVSHLAAKTILTLLIYYARTTTHA